MPLGQRSMEGACWLLAAPKQPLCSGRRQAQNCESPVPVSTEPTSRACSRAPGTTGSFQSPATHKNLSTDPKTSFFPFSSHRSLAMRPKGRDQTRAEHNLCLLVCSVDSSTFQTQPPEVPGSRLQTRSRLRNGCRNALLIYTLLLGDKTLLPSQPNLPLAAAQPLLSTAPQSSLWPRVLLHSRDVGVSSPVCTQCSL